MNGEVPKEVRAIKQNVEKSIAEHKKWGSWDAYLYNGGTAVVLLCTSLATYIPAAKNPGLSWIPPILTGLATFLVALDRALAFGPRWKFHLTQSAGYRRILDRIEIYPSIDQDNRQKHLEKLLSLLDVVRSQEPNMPGVDSPPDESRS